MQAETCNFITKRLWHRCFPVNFAKFLGTPFFINHLQWLPLPFDANVCFYSNVFQHPTIIIPGFCKVLKQWTALPRNALICYFEGKIYTYWFNTYWVIQCLRLWDAELNHLKSETSSNARFLISSRRATRGVEASPVFFWKSKKCHLILVEKTLIVFIFGLNFPFKM